MRLFGAFRSAWHDHPFASAAVWFQDRTREPLLRLSIESFGKQDWPVKELVVLNTSGAPLAWVPRHVRTLEIQRAMAPVDAWNLLLDAARGEWFLTWADDAWFEPDYVRAHVQLAHPGRASVALEQRVHLVNTGHTRTLRRWELALSCHCRPTGMRFHGDGSPEAFIRQFPSQVFLKSPPRVLRFLHDAPCHSNAPAPTVAHTSGAVQLTAAGPRDGVPARTL